MSCKKIIRIGIVLLSSLLLFSAVMREAQGIDIVLDYTLDEQNNNWFDVASSDGLARRNALDIAVDFHSNIITNDDWNSLPQLNESFSVSDLAASSLKDLDSAHGAQHSSERRKLAFCGLQVIGRNFL
jgi:hypothetical protein